LEKTNHSPPLTMMLRTNIVWSLLLLLLQQCVVAKNSHEAINQASNRGEMEARQRKSLQIRKHDSADTVVTDERRIQDMSSSYQRQNQQESPASAPTWQDILDHVREPETPFQEASAPAAAPTKADEKPFLEQFIKPSMSTSAPTAPTISPTAAPVTKAPTVEFKNAFDEPTTSAPSHKPTVAPTVPPTLAPTLPPTTLVPTAEPTVTRILQTKTVSSDTVYVQATGHFDPLRTEERLVAAMDTELNDYLRAFGGDLVQHYTVTTAFYHEYNRVETIDSRAQTTSYFSTQIEYQLQGYYGLDDFEPTYLLTRFFSGNFRLRLQRRLRDDRVQITRLALVEGLPVDGQVQEINEGDLFVGGGARIVEPSQENDDKRNHRVLIAVLMSGAFMLLIFAALLLFKYVRRQKQLRRLVDVQSLASTPPPSLQEVAATPSSGIQPAALQVTNRRKQGSHKSTSSSSCASSSSGSVYSYNQDPFAAEDYSLADVHMMNRRSASSQVAEQQLQALTEERLEQGGLVASGALTCLDDQPPAVPVSQTYPEFEAYAHIPPQATAPPSPIWSVAGLSCSEYISPRSPEVDYLPRRQMNNQTELLALPNMMEYSEDDTDDTDEQSQHSVSLILD